MIFWAIVIIGMTGFGYLLLRQFFMAEFHVDELPPLSEEWDAPSVWSYADIVQRRRNR